ncbi:NADPH-dependent FMN reductase [Paenirhodobacter populi]|uniref:NADPH-dependent oxidoreductase n=1 Tax=Paenirhodobacter populi TaxID=2306993 RepID=A0A443J6P6_9RHOB|nr:NAD(P)H-dependent oxidoreductase [Sinirhodobacter populi]RWR04085.1 NADPH-dependent oxidoreductase [Sinirhodobacter populi]RWR16182.1 NADPH-dependent oxidoreductase [Sinirhodobacter populi]
MLRFGLIIGSTRPRRFAQIPADWLLAAAADRTDFTLDVLDLREADLPFLDESFPPAMLGGAFANPKANAWRARLNHYDGFIATVAEYNHGPTAALKNAFDSAFLEWRRKPVAFVGYGTTGAARAIAQLRSIALGLEMAPVRSEVTIGLEPFIAVQNNEKMLRDYGYLNRACTALFDDLVWWASALKAARNKLRVVA